VNRAAKAYAVGKALLYDFHNSRNGRCFPRIRQSRRLRVAEYIAALEDAGILTWDQRIKRVASASSAPATNIGSSTRKLASRQFREEPQTP
jgi:hypothetical protein